MAYEPYSAIYLARRKTTELKIGETKDPRRREYQISCQYGYVFDQIFDVEQRKTTVTQDESIRKFIEAGLRVILDFAPSVHRVGNDFFDYDKDQIPERDFPYAPGG